MTGKAIVYDVLCVVIPRLRSNNFGGSISIRQCNGCCECFGITPVAGVCNH